MGSVPLNISSPQDNPTILSFGAPQFNVHQLRRWARKHGLRLVNDRSGTSICYRLESSVVVAEQLDLEDVQKILHAMRGKINQYYVARLKPEEGGR